MVKLQYPWVDDHGNEHPNLIKHYSDKDLKIQKVGTEEIFSAAVDVYPCRYTYTETDIPIPKPDPEPEEGA